MIKSILLENWKTHHNSLISFTKGTNIFVGKIGAGKSSIIDAVCYSFYGTYPALQTKKLTLSETIMFKPIKKDKAKVVLSFEHNSCNYTIEREIFSEKTNTAKLYQNNKLLAGPKQTDVNEKVSEILEIDYNLFIKIVYSEQNEMDYFLKMAPGKRKEQFDSLFGINTLENIKINSRELIRLLSSDKHTQETLCIQINQQLSNFDISKTETELTRLVLEKKEQENQIIEQTTQKKKLEEKYKTEQMKKHTYETQNTEKSILESKIKEINLLLAERKETRTEDIKKLKERKEQTEKKIKEIEEENKIYEITKKNLDNQYSFYLEQMMSLDKQTQTLSSKLVFVDIEKLNLEKKETEKNQTDIFLRKSEKHAQLIDLKKAIEELKKGFSRCPVCDSQLTKEQLVKKLLEKQTLEKKIIDEISILGNNQKEIHERLDAIKNQEKNAEENEKIKRAIIDMEDKQKYYRKINQELEQKIKEVPEQKDLSKIKDEFIEITQAIEYRQLLEKKKDLESRFCLLNDAILALEYSEDKFLLLLTDYKTIETKINHLISQKENIEKQEQILKSNCELYNKLKSQEQKIKEQLEHLETHTQNVSYFITALESSQYQLRKVLVDDINKSLELIWTKIYPYGDYVSARLKAENDYVLEVQTKDGDWIRVEGILSGGERTCAALSIRVAIALSLTKKLGLLILDEPTHNLDNKTISMLSTILDKDLPELVEQIFIVTHDSKLLDTSNSSKYIIERDKENDGVSNIIK